MARPGKGTGWVRCTVKIPALDIVTEKSFLLWRERDTLASVVHFIRSQLPETQAQAEGASFRVHAEIRATKLGRRWKKLSEWLDGEPLELAIQRANEAWRGLAREKKPDSVEEVEFEEAVERVKGRARAK
jgi:hypothetical protein